MGRYPELLRYVRPYLGLVVAALVATIVGTLFDGFTFALVIPFLRRQLPGPATATRSPTSPPPTS